MDWQFKVGLAIAVGFVSLQYLVKAMPLPLTWAGLFSAALMALWGIPLVNQKVPLWPGFLIIIGGAAITAGIVLVVQFLQNPTNRLAIAGVVDDAEYPPNTVLSGISWRPEFTGVRLHLNNVSEEKIYEIDLTIKAAEPIAAIAQATSVPGCFLQSLGASDIQQWMQNTATQNKRANPLVMVATTMGYKLHCADLPGGNRITILLALTQLKPPKPFQPRVDGGIFDSDYWLRLNFGESSIWLGHKDGDVYALPRPEPGWIEVSGSYTADGVVTNVSKRQVLNKIQISVPHVQGDRSRPG